MLTDFNSSPTFLRRANTIREATSCATNELRNSLNTCNMQDDIIDCNAVDLHSITPYVLLVFDRPLPLITSVVSELCSAVSLGYYFIPSTNVQFDKNLYVSEYTSFRFFKIKLTFIIPHFVFSYAYSLLLS